MRKLLLLATAALALIFGGSAFAANVPFVTGPGPNEPSQTNATINGVIQSIISGVSGYIGGTVGPINSTATTAAQTLASTVIPSGTLNAAGQSLHIHCWGTTGANTNSKTMRINFGGNVFATVASAANAQTWDLEMFAQTSTGSTVSAILGRGGIGTLPVTPLASSDTVDNYAGALTASCGGTQGTASAADIVLQGFTIEQIK
jgi:hypothetical protein